MKRQEPPQAAGNELSDWVAPTRASSNNQGSISVSESLQDVKLPFSIFISCLFPS